MITPLDIQNKEFSRAVRGYNQEEVDLFLDEIMADYDKLLSENQDLKRQLEETKGKVESYKDTEGAVLKTLEAAKSLMNDISASAEKRASILVKNAELDALQEACRSDAPQQYPWTPHTTILIDEPETVFAAIPVFVKSFVPFTARIVRLHLCAFWPTREIASFALEGVMNK